MFDEWVTEVVARLKQHAWQTKTYPMRYEYDSDEAYRAAVSPNHGTPLFLDFVDPRREVDLVRSRALADAHVPAVDPDANRFLHSADELNLMGFEGVPYTSEAR